MELNHYLKLENRLDAENLLLELVKPLFKYKDSSLCRFNLNGRVPSYSDSISGMEAFSRPLWGLIPYWLGGSRNKEIEEFYIKGLTLGPDPNYPNWWGETENASQYFVEMAPIAFAIIAIPEILWDPLLEDAKTNLATWLYSINEHNVPKCNWVFFRIFINTALKARNRKFSAEKLKEDKEFIESNYLGNGWYKDGKTGRVDYYSAFAMQFYSILLAYITKDNIPLTLERAEEFALSFKYWFSSTGEGLPYGRSLTYRFAEVSFFSALLLLEPKRINKGIIKGIINRNIRYFLTKDIFSDGVLQIGYTYCNDYMAEKYNGPGSPYWAFKAFLFLALSKDNEYWRIKEEELDNKIGVKYIKEVDIMIQNRGFDVQLYTPGKYKMPTLGHFNEKYYKFVYSTMLPFSTSNSLESPESAALDSTLSFMLTPTLIVPKSNSESFTFSDNSLVINWSIGTFIKVRTEIVLTENGHIRNHEVESMIETEAYDSAFAISSSSIVDESENVILVKNEECWEEIKGEGENATPYLIKAFPNTNLKYKRSIIPSIKYKIKVGKNYFKTTIGSGKNE